MLPSHLIQPLANIDTGMSGIASEDVLLTESFNHPLQANILP